MPITHHTPAVSGAGNTIPKLSYNEEHDYSDLDASTLDGWSLNDILNEIPSGNSTVQAQTLQQLPNNLLLLWDKSIGEIPSGYEEIEALSGTEFTVIKYVGGEEMTNCVISLRSELDADTSLSISSQMADRSLIGIAANTDTLNDTLQVEKDDVITITISNASVGATKNVYVSMRTLTDDTIFDTTITVGTESNRQIILMVSQPCSLYVGFD